MVKINEQKQKLINILKFLGIDYTTSTSNAVNVCCPFCPSGDDNYHCGIFFDDFNYTCWKYKAGGSLFELLTELTGISFRDYRELMQSGQTPTGDSALDQINNILSQELIVKGSPKEIIWPPYGSVKIDILKTDPLVLYFLKKRNLSIDFCINKEVRIGVIGRYIGRFIIPIYFKGAIVAYQARDMTEKADNRYLTEGDISYFLYGLDDIDPTKPVAITEGIFDNWAVKDNVVSSFSKSLSDTQIDLMKQMNPPYWILSWDIGEDGSDAFWHARVTCNQLTGLFGSDKAVYVTLPTGTDPAELGYEKMEKILSKVR